MTVTTTITPGPDPERIPRQDLASDAWVRTYRTVAALNPHLSGDDLVTAVEKHFGGAA